MRGAAYVFIALAWACGGAGVHKDTRAYAFGEPCGQGPYEVGVAAAGEKWGEGLEVVACTPRAVAGYYEMRAGQQPLMSGRFGSEAANSRCVRGARPARAGAESPEAGGGESDRRVEEPSAEPAPRADALRALAIEDDGASARSLCADMGLEKQTIFEVDFHGDGEGFLHEGEGFFREGAELRVRFWSQEPNDWEDATLLVRQRIFEEERRQRGTGRRRAASDDERPAAARPPIADEPPPPPEAEERPPRPVHDATWVSGYWVQEGEGWAWIPGFWRAPERSSPRAAPPAQEEEVGDPPAADAVWVEGHWHWTGSEFVWIRGHWEVRAE